MSQEEKVFEYLKANGSITSYEAAFKLRILRLSAKIFNLRRRGYDITSKLIIERRGDKTVSYTRYRLAESHE